MHLPTAAPNSQKTVYCVWYIYLLYIHVLLVCYRAALECQDYKMCAHQVVGHMYPATFMIGLALSCTKPHLRATECLAMIGFWLAYWICDAVQQSGVNFNNPDTLQNYLNTMLIGLCGLYRHVKGPKSDKVVMVFLGWAFALYVSMHSQPNVIGATMCTFTAIWLGCFVTAYIVDAKLEASTFMVLAATTFASSQIGLTSVASQYMDPMAYFALIGTLSLFVCYIIDV